MSINVSMPKLGMTMKTGKVSRWSKKEGDRVQKGEELFEVETEKITYKVVAPEGGILFQIVVAEGMTCPVGSIVAVISEPGEEPERIEGTRVPGVTESAPSAAQTLTIETEAAMEKGRIAATPAAKRLAGELGVDLALVKGTGPEGRIKEADVAGYHEQARRKRRITPLAEEIARKAGLDVGAISGSGEEER